MGSRGATALDVQRVEGMKIVHEEKGDVVSGGAVAGLGLVWHREICIPQKVPADKLGK